MINLVFDYKNAKGQPRRWILSQFVISGLRRMSYKVPMRAAALSRARIKRGWYKCEVCGKIIKKSAIAIDHKLPIVPVNGWDNFDGYIKRLFCLPGEIQVICRTPCHLEKTKAETKERKKYRKAKNGE